VNVVAADNVYTPLVTLRDQHGHSYGDAAAMIEYRTGDLAGGRVIYVWNSLRLYPAHQQTILTDLLRFLLTNTMPPPAEYACVRVVERPVIDGRLDDQAWQQAPATEAFVRFDENRADGKTLTTTAKLAWDDQALYVAWECEDPDIWSTIAERDGNLWEGEVVEAYVDPDGNGKDYREFEISPLNTVIDLSIPQAVGGQPQDVEGARKWNATGWETAVKVQGTLDDREDADTRWTAEAAIPWANFAGAKRLPPRVGDIWRIQLFRIDRSESLPNPQFSAWSPTDTFHNPSRFGRLFFGGNQ
jgi:hypothetical protein